MKAGFLELLIGKQRLFFKVFDVNFFENRLYYAAFGTRNLSWLDQCFCELTIKNPAVFVRSGFSII